MVEVVILTDILPGSVLACAEQDGEVELREKRTLIVGLVGPALNLFHAKLAVMDGTLPVFNVALADDVQDHGLESGLRHGFMLGARFIDRDCVPDHLSLFEKRLVGVAIVVLDQQEQVINDGTGCDGTLVVAILMEESVEEDLL